MVPGEGREPLAGGRNRSLPALLLPLPLPPLQGLEIVFRVGLALLQVNQAELMQLDMEGMSQVGQEGQGWRGCPQPGAPSHRMPLQVTERAGLRGWKVACLTSLICFHPLCSPEVSLREQRTPRLCQTQLGASSLAPG